jgi:hypothetical protein
MPLRPARDLGWRPADPTRDTDDDGRALQSNYVVIVRLKDCRFYSKKEPNRFGDLVEREYYDPSEAPQAFKLGMEARTTDTDHGGPTGPFGSFRP